MAKKKKAAEPTPKPYEIVGLRKSDRMPVVIDGREVDLARITPELEAWLRARKDICPYIRWNNG
ncbi:hypothetical protein GCM10027275_24960 [Rhabdobacter roseus]|uniref:Uncharacterized protein n=1 Tax=Rhabdobacter roseus TaxID=1655419 RepID=A0A840TJQ6_9BACT|nr:hypothetical protein [Rhabdobacter roseus]MBB5284436.1 hypothetical protein [Rhabdobacter roseus]